MTTICFLSLSAIVLFSIACQKQPDATTDVSSEQNKLTYGQLIGKRLECIVKDGKADVYMVAPHLLAIPASNPEYLLEYFRTDFLTKEGALHYQSAFLGKGDYKTTTIKPDELGNRRIKLAIMNNKIHILVAHGLDENKQPMMPNEMVCEVKEQLKNFLLPMQK